MSEIPCKSRFGRAWSEVAAATMALRQMGVLVSAGVWRVGMRDSRDLVSEGDENGRFKNGVFGVGQRDALDVP